jgi:hypothetical protein
MYAEIEIPSSQTDFGTGMSFFKSSTAIRSRDGTGQAGGTRPDENRSNIYKLYRATRCGPDTDIDPREQLAFYDAGLGSQPPGGALFVTRAYRWLHNVASQATGLGITTNIIDCYAAIIRMWEPRGPHLPVRFQPRRVHGQVPGRRARPVRRADENAGRFAAPPRRRHDRPHRARP